MAFQDIVQSAKRFFGADNSFFHGPRDYEPQTAREEAPAPHAEAPVPPQAENAYPQQSYQQPAYQQPQQNAYQQPAYQQPAYQQAPYGQMPQQGYPQQPQPVQQPQQQNAQPFFQQGYRPPQPQQNPNEFVAPRNRRSAQHQQQMQMPQQGYPQQPQPVQQPDPAGTVVPFPGAPQQSQQIAKTPNACVINVRGIGDCRNAIGMLRSNDCVIAVMDNIADQAEVRRYVDTLNGACFSLGCTMTRLSARVGVYLLAPAGMTVYTDQATTQMNSQSRAPQRQQRPAAPQGFRTPYQAAAPYQAQPSPYAPPQGYNQPQQMNAPAYTTQEPAAGYAPDAPDAEYNAI
ncbi:MAG: cell division protein SepF [Clostridia bacterium]|nr:cell division protein SepF [Clostridia bacterium]